MAKTPCRCTTMEGPSGYVTCYICRGDKRAPANPNCKHCRGSGYYECPVCKGKGYVKG